MHHCNVCKISKTNRIARIYLCIFWIYIIYRKITGDCNSTWFWKSFDDVVKKISCFFLFKETIIICQHHSFHNLRPIHGIMINDYKKFQITFLNNHFSYEWKFYLKILLKHWAVLRTNFLVGLYCDWDFCLKAIKFGQHQNLISPCRQNHDWRTAEISWSQLFTPQM